MRCNTHLDYRGNNIFQVIPAIVTLGLFVLCYRSVIWSYDVVHLVWTFYLKPNSRVLGTSAAMLHTWPSFSNASWPFNHFERIYVAEMKNNNRMIHPCSPDVSMYLNERTLCLRWVTAARDHQLASGTTAAADGTDSAPVTSLKPRFITVFCLCEIKGNVNLSSAVRVSVSRPKAVSRKAKKNGIVNQSSQSEVNVVLAAS